MCCVSSSTNAVYGVINIIINNISDKIFKIMFHLNEPSIVWLTQAPTRTRMRRRDKQER